MAATTIMHLTFSLLVTSNDVSVTHVELCIQTYDKYSTYKFH
jgi:hypothetical protein